MSELYAKLKSICNIETLFFLYILTFPFGAKLLSFSIGFMTLYPNLIFALIIFFLGLKDYKYIFKYKFEFYYLLFVFIWFIFSIVHYFFLEGKANAIIDIRSLGIMFITSFVFIWIKNKIGFEKWRSILSYIFKVIFILITLFAVLEVMTGIHFLGNFTEKISNMPSASFAYAPVFLYDNQNTLIVYFLLIGLLSVMLDKDIVKKPSFVFLMMAICFLFSQISLARIGNFASLIMLFLFGFFFIPNIIKSLKNRDEQKRKLYPVLLISLLLMIVVFTNKKFYGPIWKNSVESNLGLNTTPVKSNIDSISKIDENYVFGDHYALRLEKVTIDNKEYLDSNYNSSKIRLALILNGYYFFKENSLFGIGPGQYRDKHQKSQQMFYTKTNISPHFWLVEVLSQFGLIIFIPYLAWLLWILITSIKYLKSQFIESMLIIIGLIVFLLSSLLPSSFLILDIHWIFLVVLIILSSQLNSIEKVK